MKYAALEKWLSPVVGTTGFTNWRIAELKNFRDQDLGVIDLNFALVLSCSCNLRRKCQYFPNVDYRASSKEKDAPVEQPLKQLNWWPKFESLFSKVAWWGRIDCWCPWCWLWWHADPLSSFARLSSSSESSLAIRRRIDPPSWLLWSQLLLVRSIWNQSCQTSWLVYGLNTYYEINANAFWISEALPILKKKIKEAGFEAYFVGVLFRCPPPSPIHDVDIATSSIRKRPSRFFPNSRYRNRAWNHLGFRWRWELEVTTFRTEDVWIS